MSLPPVPVACPHVWPESGNRCGTAIAFHYRQEVQGVTCVRGHFTAGRYAAAVEPEILTEADVPVMAAPVAKRPRLEDLLDLRDAW